MRSQAASSASTIRTARIAGPLLVVGGVVQKTMGQFGQPSPSRGYDRDWVYDERFRHRALSPPAFPAFPNYTASTSLGIDMHTAPRPLLDWQA